MLLSLGYNNKKNCFLFLIRGEEKYSRMNLLKVQNPTLKQGCVI